jgi:uncharacterized oxidoreductase
MQTTGNTVLITGGASGIGLELAKAFIRRNNSVVVCGRDREKLAHAQREAPSLAVKHCDLSVATARADLVAWILDRFPSLNMLVNNAGIVRPIELTENRFDFEKIEQELTTNLLAPIDLTLRFLTHLRGQPTAAVVNVTTGQVYSPNAGTPVYSSAKVGLHTWTDALRYQLRDMPIKVFEVLPPIVDTEMIRRLGVHSKDAVPASQVADAVLKAISRDTVEIRVGQTKLLYAASRIAPHAVYSALNRQIEKMKRQPGAGALAH